jgi:hypothetical protein
LAIKYRQVYIQDLKQFFPAKIRGRKKFHGSNRSQDPKMLKKNRIKMHFPATKGRVFALCIATL